MQKKTHNWQLWSLSQAKPGRRHVGTNNNVYHGGVCECIGFCGKYCCFTASYCFFPLISCLLLVSVRKNYGNMLRNRAALQFFSSPFLLPGSFSLMEVWRQHPYPQYGRGAHCMIWLHFLYDNYTLSFILLGLTLLSAYKKNFCISLTAINLSYINVMGFVFCFLPKNNVDILCHLMVKKIFPWRVCLYRKK